jgi:hypothetical protein
MHGQAGNVAGNFDECILAVRSVGDAQLRSKQWVPDQTTEVAWPSMTVCTCVYVYVCMYVCVCMCMCMCMCMYLWVDHMFECVYTVQINLQTYECTHTHTHTQTKM